MDSFDSTWEIPKNFNWNKIQEEATGIDLGTTRCCCAVSRKNEIIETAALDLAGERLLPSFIGYEEENIKCGKLVSNRLNNYHKSAVFDVKRVIGKKFEEIILDPSWTFSVTSDADGNPLIETEHVGNLVYLPPSEVSAALLKHIKNKAEEFQGKKLDKVVITVPAVFTNQQCRDTLKAAFLAEWKSVTLLPEPIAAAFSYYFDQRIPNNSTLLLFDLGGGTLDVCIFKIMDDKFKIISSAGDSEIGGRDFDNVLFQYFQQKLENEFKIKHLEKRKYKLLSKCQEIKEALSATSEYSFDVSDFDTTKDDAYIKITRNDFELLSRNLIDRINATINAALTDKNNALKPNEINNVLLVGGGSRMPMIQDLLRNIFPHAEQRADQNPDEVVAKGAAYYACHLLSNPGLGNKWCTEETLSDVEIPKVRESIGEPQDDVILTVHQGPDEVASNQTMESIITIDSKGNIEGETALKANHWIWGFRGGVRVNLFDKDGHLLWESKWYVFGVNMYSNSLRHWDHQVPNEVLVKVKTASIIHKHNDEIE